MRIRLIVIAPVLAGSAQAQYPGAGPYGPSYAQPVYSPPAYPQPYNSPANQLPGYQLYPTSPAPYGGRSAAPSVLIVQAMLQAHNAVRARVGVPPLVWSERLVAVAQDWADHLIAANAFSHRPDNEYGENLYAISGGSTTPDQVVQMWADEARGYDLRSNTCQGVCGHYTQLVWSKTKAVGCAAAANGYREIWVCNYDPPGNWVGFRPY